MRRAADDDRCQSDDDGKEREREKRDGAFVSREISRELKLKSGQMCEE